MANKQTHTVRTVSRRTSGGMDSLNQNNAQKENKKSLFKRMMMVIVIVLVLLGILLALEFFSKKNMENKRRIQPALSTQVVPDNNMPAVNLDILEETLKEEEKKTSNDSNHAPDVPEEKTQDVAPTLENQENQNTNPVPSDAPARTPFDDLNFVEPAQHNAPKIEQRITENGETILKITPQKTQKTQPTQTLTKEKTAQKTQEKDSSKITPEETNPLPIESNQRYAPPTAQGNTEMLSNNRMPNHRYRVQAGIFLENARARALYQKIVDAGIPAVMETRVQVGPFNTRKEAENAQKRLQKIGIDSMIITPHS